MSNAIPGYVKNSGASIISKNVLERRAPLRWAFREEGVDAVDSGRIELLDNATGAPVDIPGA